MATTLAAGDIAILGMNADNPDSFSFVLLAPVTSGTQITFTDSGWNNATGTFRPNEGAQRWTAASDLPAGTVINFVANAAQFAAANDTIVGTSGVALSTDGDQLIAFQGSSASPTLLYALSIHGNAFSDATNAQSTGLPAGLVLNETAVARGRLAPVAGGSGGEWDNAVYTGPTNGTKAGLLAAIGNPANWTGSDTALTQPTANFTVDAGTPATTITSIAIDDDSKPEGDSFQYTVTLSGPVVADTVVTLAASGATGDLVSVPASVTVLAGQSTASFAIATVEDGVTEPNEAFTVTATLGASSRQVTATIENDDTPATSVIGGVTILAQAASLQGSVATPVATNTLNLNRVGGYLSGDGEGGAESISFDTGNDRAYVTNATLDRIDILDLSNPRLPSKIGFIDLAASLTPAATFAGFSYGNVNSVAVLHGGAIAVAVQNADGGSNGVVAIYGANGALIKTIEVGALPDQLTYHATSASTGLLLVANEGERFVDRSGPTPVVENPAGSVSVIAVPAIVADAAVRNTVGFTALDAFEAELDALGVKTYDGGASFAGGTITVGDSLVSQDIEPEYVAVSADGTKAYVTLQEVNAVAVIDLTNASADRPVSLLPLGFVDFSLPGNEADFSDRDGAGGGSTAQSISVGNSPIKGLLQPDAIASFEVGGATYFITANEGDSRIISDATLGDPALNEARASAVQSGAPADYARVNVDTVWSNSGDLYAFGGRGFSIFRQNADGTIVKVEETGGDIEQIVAALPNAATVFNGENGGGFDTRSDNKGAEAEGVAVGTVDGVPYAFVALERLGGVMVWDLSNPEDARFVRYMAPTSQDYGPEVIKFVSAAESPNGRALVLSANEISGSVTIYEATNLTAISAIQGTGTASALVGRTVTVEAIVVGDFQNGDADAGRNLGGFFLQEEAFDQDGNPLSSEGIFVSQGSLPADVQIGDRVRVTGTVAESFGNTEINASSIAVVQAGAVADIDTLAVEIDLPAGGVQGVNGSYTANLEAYEGMLVRFPETLTITEQFNLDQFGEIRVMQGERPNSYTVDNEASVAGYDAHLRDIASRSVIFDDGRSISNPNLDNTVVDGDYSTATAPRMGDTVTGLTGVLDYDFSQFRVHAVESGVGVNDFVTANPRPTTFPDVGGTLKIASFNVLNYFTTLDNGQSTANGFEPRGAETAAEFQRQTDKLVNTILTLDADVLGLMELENNFAEGASGNAIAYLVDQLNATAGTFKFDWVRPGQQFVGGDAIAVGFIYDVTSVEVSFGSAPAILDDSDVSAALLAQSSIGAIFNGANTSRAALAVTFEELATGGEFTAVVNHFKSKGGSGTGADADIRDGNGGWNNQRELAAEALIDWLDTNPTGSADEDILILGDLNAYEKEDPIDVLRGAGYTDQGAGSYGYVFDGQTGSLDHILTNGSLSAQVTGVADWHINADEADALDYQLNFNADLTTNERDPSIFNAEIIARVSDHDPIVIGLDLTENPVYTLQLLHLSDGEAGLLAGSTAKNLAALVDAFDDDYANTLILAGGDTFLPGPFLAAGTDPSVIATLNAVSGSTIAASATVPIGAVDTTIHNVIGVEVSAIGNHEWDLGSNAFAGSIAPGGGFVGANYALVSANLDFSGDAAINPRFTNTVGNGATPTALASTLKGRIAPAVVVEKGGEKIGIVGATTQILESISSPTGTEVKGFPTGLGANGEFDDMVLLASQLQPVIDELRAEGINKIILQAHLQNIANEKLLATLLKGVDIILAAGSNTRLGDADDEAVAFPGHAANFAETYPLVIEDADGNNTLLVNTDNEYTYLGRLKVDFDSAGNIIVENLEDDAAINGAYASTAENVAEAWGTTVDNLEATAFANGTKGDKVRDLTDAVSDVIEVKDGNVFGFTDVYLEGERAFVRSEETNLGSLSADANAYALREALGASDETVIVSFKNGGGIRAQIGTLSAPDPIDGSVDKLPPPANPDAGKPEGGVSQLDIENSLRFNNRLMAFDTTAAGLKAILEHGVAAGTLQGRFPQIGGVSFSWDPDLPAGSRISDIALIDGNGRSYALYDKGVLQAGVPATITVVTLNFLANGGDGYPAKANGSNFRYLLDNGTLSGPVDESLDYTAPAVIAANTPAGTALLGEQQALAEFMQEFHGTQDSAFDIADTAVQFDERIQNLNFRNDTVLAAVDDAPELIASSLSPALASNALFATLGIDDLAAVDDEGQPLTYTLTSLPAGLLLVDGEIAAAGARFSQEDIAAGRVTLLAGPVLPVGAVATPNGAIPGVGIVFADSFDFSLSDGLNTVAGSFTAGYAPFDTVQTAAQYGGYWGGNGNDYLLGTAGADNMSGGNGHDELIGGGGNDQLNGGEGNNRLFGQAGNDQLNGGNGNDLLDGGENDDTLNGNGGDNILVGGGGNDQINAGEGKDLIFGGAGNDTINANGGNNRINAGSGDDRITAGNGGDTITAGAGNDVVYANGGNNKVQFGGVAGSITDGNDQFYTGNGADKFALYLNDRDGNAAGFGNDTVFGFRIAEGDQLVAFNPTAGFWDDTAQLTSLINGGFISGQRSADGGDLTLSLAAGQPQASSVTLKWFFWDNQSFLSASEKATANGATIGAANLAGILQDVIQDGGAFGASGADFLDKAHSYVSNDFLI